MHIAIYGTGGIGGYLAGKLGVLLRQEGGSLKALSLVARGPHLDTIQKNGLTFIDVEGNSHCIHPTAAAEKLNDPSFTAAGASTKGQAGPGAGPPDFVFLCVKGYDLGGAVDKIVEQLGLDREEAGAFGAAGVLGTPGAAGAADTTIIPLLNGADIYERVRSRMPGGRVLPGAIYISSAVTEAGTVQHKGGPGKLILGKGLGEDAQQPEQLLGLLEAAGIPYEWHDDPFPAIWGKFLFISPFSLATAVTAKTLGELLSEEKLTSDIRTMMEEVAAVARAKGIALPADAVDSTMAKAAAFPPETKTSFQRDIEAGRKKDERDLFGGTVLRLGAELGVSTPMVEKYFKKL